MGNQAKLKRTLEQIVLISGEISVMVEGETRIL